MSLKPFYHYGADSSLDMRCAAPRLGPAAESQAAVALADEREQWGEKLPGDADALWT